MNKKLLIISALILPMVFINNGINSSPTGTPGARTGSPGDGGGTCFTSGCHSGSPTEAVGILSTNVPTEGYTPNTAYTVTVTLTGTGNKGFQVSPQSPTGALLGTLASGVGNWVIGKFVTHSTPKNIATAIWTFQWTAPAKGTGDVNFYGAFAITRNTTKTQVLKVSEKAGSSVNEALAFTAKIFPNPVSNELKLSFNTLVKNATVTLFDINGNEVLSQQFENSLENSMDVNNVKDGNYIVKVIADNKVYNKKIAINH
ncbi:MAG: choice-of-anchor V domain-containing protein [Bacteroidia bacterium]